MTWSSIIPGPLPGIVLRRFEKIKSYCEELPFRKYHTTREFITGIGFGVTSKGFVGAPIECIQQFEINKDFNQLFQCSKHLRKPQSDEMN
jgi:hypothetical protein